MPDTLTTTLGEINPLRRDTFSTFANFANEKPHAAAKAVYVAIDCLEQANLIPDGYEEQFENAHDALYLAKLSKGPWEILERTNNWMGSVRRAFEEPSIGNTLDIGRKTAGIIGPVKDTVNFAVLAKIVDVSKETMATIKEVGGWGLGVVFGWNALDDLYEISQLDLNSNELDAKGRTAMENMTRCMIDLAKSISYVAIATLTLLSIYFGVLVAPVWMVALSASTVVFTILGYFNKHWGEPIPIKH